MSDDSDRLERLELLLMAHEESLEQFDRLVRDQQRQIGELGKQLDRLEEKLSKYDEEQDPGQQHQPPPHY